MSRVLSKFLAPISDRHPPPNQPFRDVHDEWIAFSNCVCECVCCCCGSPKTPHSGLDDLSQTLCDFICNYCRSLEPNSDHDDHDDYDHDGDVNVAGSRSSTAKSSSHAFARARTRDESGRTRTHGHTQQNATQRGRRVHHISAQSAQINNTISIKSTMCSRARRTCK